MITPFADRLMDRVRTHGPLCLGIDPHPALLPSLFGMADADAAANWGKALVARATGKVAVVKPQAGLFERWGSKGLAALEQVCETARKAGLLVLLDAKRGDIGTTADGYAEGYLGEASTCPCDAITVNPYMGIETIEPFVKVAERQGKGVVVLVRTSNPGSQDFQARLVDGEPVYLHVVRALRPMIERLRAESGWSGLMLVAGATGPEDARRIREAAGGALFLVPGYGAQGGGAGEAVAGFVRRGDILEGGVVNASRSVASPEGAMAATTAAEWDALIDRAIDAAQADLNAAIRA